MKKIINRKNAAAVACAAMMICAAGVVPDSVLSVSMPVPAGGGAGRANNLRSQLKLRSRQICLRSQG